MKKILLVLISFQFYLAESQVIWSADPSQSTNENNFFRRFDSGNYPSDYCSTVGDEAGVPPSTVTTTNDPVHGKVWKVNKPINRKRGELARAEGTLNSYTAKEGDDIYIGWRWKIDTENGAKITQESTVWQWKSEGTHDQNYPLNMEYDGDLTFNAWGPDYANNSSQAAMRTVLWRKAVPQNTWVTFVVRIKIDKDDFGGLVQFWFNGEPQKLTNAEFDKYQVNLSSDKYTANHRTNDGSGVYPKWGIYNKKSCEYNASAYFDEMKIGESLSSVMPSGSTTPNSPPTVKMTSPSNGATFNIGETINLNATASDDGSVAKVNFKVNGAYYSQDQTMPYTGSFTPTETGIYVLSARAFDDEDAQTEDAVTVTVVQPNRAPSGYFVEPSFDEIEEGYTQLYVKVKDTDIDGDSVDITLYIDDVLIRKEQSGAFEWGHITPAGTDLRGETLNLTPGMHVLKAVILDERGMSATITKQLRVTSTVTGIFGFNENKVEVYPNPSNSGVFHLDNSMTFEVYDVQGHLVLQGSNDKIDLSGMPKGVYVLQTGDSVIRLMK